MQTIAIPEGAFSIQRMIDIDADPVLFHHQIYAATYQGKIASLDWAMGSVNWARDISSYTGMTAEGQSIYITDAKGHVWAFDARNGDIKWQQSQLTARILSAPANMDNEIVVGDAEGYLHWLNKQDGHFAAREFVGAAIYAAPLVDDHVVYAFTSNGYLTAYGVD
jgi:outer membrane protein assembly factor BamB